MARKTRAGEKSNTSNLVTNLKNIPSSSNAKKTRSMEEILGVQPLEFESSDDDPLDDLGENISPRSSLRELQQQSEIRPLFHKWMTAIQSNKAPPATPVLQVNPSWSNYEIRAVISNSPCLNKSGNNGIVNDNVTATNMQLNLSTNVNVGNDGCVEMPCEVKIGINDIQDEVDYWNSAVICYVLGANRLYM